MSNFRFDGVRPWSDTSSYARNERQSLAEALRDHRAASRNGERGQGNGWGRSDGWARGWGTQTNSHANFHSQVSPQGTQAQGDWASAIFSNLFSSLALGSFNAQGGRNPGFDFNSSFSFDPDGNGPQRARTVSMSISSRSEDACGCNAGDAEATAVEPANGQPDTTAEADEATAAETAASAADDIATTADTAAAQEQAACKLAADAPADAEPVPEEPVVDEPIIDEPAVEETALEEPALDEPVIVEAAEEHPAEDTAVTEDCAVDETPVAENPVEEAPEDDIPEHDVSGDGKGWGDPHFVGADGERYDVQGEAGKFYNLLSDKGMQVNAQFSTYAGNMTVMSELGVTAGSDQIRIGKNAALSINGETIDKDGVYLDGKVERSLGKVTVKTDEYSVAASGSAYLDVIFSGRNVQRDGVMPAGIWGVTLDGDGKPRLSGGMFGTEGGSMQGGGVLEKADGTLSDKDDVSTYKEYEVASLMDLLFPSHNRYAA